MSARAARDINIRIAEGEADVRACFPLMQQLRPHLENEDAFVDRWQPQTAEGYRILALWQDGHPAALAGFRVQHNMIHGRFLYVDDLVTDTDARSSGHGTRLIDRLQAEARAAGCRRLTLDAALDNVFGHRFYYRQGLLARGLHFGIPVRQEGAIDQ